MNAVQYILKIFTKSSTVLTFEFSCGSYETDVCAEAKSLLPKVFTKFLASLIAMTLSFQSYAIPMIHSLYLTCDVFKYPGHVFNLSLQSFGIR